VIPVDRDLLGPHQLEEPGRHPARLPPRARVRGGGAPARWRTAVVGGVVAHFKNSFTTGTPARACASERARARVRGVGRRRSGALLWWAAWWRSSRTPSPLELLQEPV